MHILRTSALFVVAFFCLGGLVTAKADEGGEPSAASENFYKDKQFLPGEEVVTPTGQRIKVWSTKGPVDVDRAPDPFDDPHKTHLNEDTDVVIDALEVLDRNRSGGNVSATPQVERNN